MDLRPICLLAGLATAMTLASPASGGEGEIPAADRVPLTAEQRRWLEENQPLRLCVDPDWLPFEAIDRRGRHVGMGADFMDLMTARAGIETELLETEDWPETLQRARQGDCDVLPLAMETSGRAEFLNFTEPYLETPSVIATLDSRGHISDLSKVSHLPLGIMRDFSFVEIYREQYPRINLVEVDSYEDGVAGVQSGQLFGMLGNMASIGYAIQQMRAPNVKISGRIDGDSRLSVATRKDEPMLAEVFEAAVASLSPRDRQEIINAWYQVQFEEGRNYTLFAGALAVMVLIFLAGLFWGYRLRTVNLGLEQANRQLTELTRKDSLTGLYNRAYLDVRLSHALAHCRRNRSLLSVAMLDLDHFKQINDSLGHAFGDQCLRRVSDLLREYFQRATETVARYGGEEFVVLCEENHAEQFIAQLERFRLMVASEPVAFEGQSTFLTVSIGLWSAVPGSGDSALDCLLRADAALYEAKHQGRNRLIIRRGTPRGLFGRGRKA